MAADFGLEFYSGGKLLAAIRQDGLSHLILLFGVSRGG